FDAGHVGEGDVRVFLVREAVARAAEGAEHPGPAAGAAQAADAPGGRFGWGTVMIALVVGIMVGLAIGLVVARALWAPVEISVTPASPATITPE
ncbi:MAG: hypothetical protein L6R48_26095, partial [Planctomycetes bacterium]|nr:hypothetical protein [Planctomycetota bacterium]